MRRIIYSLLLSLILTPAAFAVSTCTDIIEQMSAHHKNPGVKSYPWMEFSWIQNVFGDAQTHTINETRYSWNNYHLIVRNGQTYDEAGHKPKQLSEFQFAPTLEQAVKALGKPKQETTATLNEYRWACTDTSSTLSITANNENKMVDSSFFYCSGLSEAGCRYGHLS